MRQDYFAESLYVGGFMNPCPCGYLGTDVVQVLDAPNSEVQSLQAVRCLTDGHSREAPAVRAEDLQAREKGEPSEK